jgi:hypothetical protein
VSGELSFGVGFQHQRKSRCSGEVILVIFGLVDFVGIERSMNIDMRLSRIWVFEIRPIDM